MFPEIHPYFDEHCLKNEGLWGFPILFKNIIKTE